MAQKQIKVCSVYWLVCFLMLVSVCLLLEMKKEDQLCKIKENTTCGWKVESDLISIMLASKLTRIVCGKMS